MADMKLTDVEKEVALLLAARKLIKAMVNRSMLAFGDNYSELTVVPQTTHTAEMFNILLVDFVSQLGSPYASKTTMLSGLAGICDAPHFDANNSIQPLSFAVAEMDAWLNRTVRFNQIWLPSIDKELDLTMIREEFIYICGNIAKHNTFRLSKVAQKLQKILQRSDPTTTLQEGYLAIEDFYEWFHRDKFLYHLSKLSQMLNNISWGIQDYLKPEYQRSYSVDEEASAAMRAVMYKFDYPSEVSSEMGRVFYWDLMNEIRAEPYIPRFGVPAVLTQRY